jgi:hypothetical protein
VRHWRRPVPHAGKSGFGSYPALPPRVGRMPTPASAACTVGPDSNGTDRAERTRGAASRRPISGCAVRRRAPTDAAALSGFGIRGSGFEEHPLDSRPATIHTQRNTLSRMSCGTGGVRFRTPGNRALAHILPLPPRVGVMPTPDSAACTVGPDSNGTDRAERTRGAASRRPISGCAVRRRAPTDAASAARHPADSVSGIRAHPRPVM